MNAPASQSMANPQEVDWPAVFTFLGNKWQWLVGIVFGIVMALPQTWRFLKTFYQAVQMATPCLQALPHVSKMPGQLTVILAKLDANTKELRIASKTVDVLVDTQFLAIYRCDELGNCFAVNRTWQEWTGLNEDEANGKGWLLAVHPDDRERVKLSFYGSVRDGSPFSERFRYWNGRTGETRLVQSRTHDVKEDESGVRIAIIGISRLIELKVTGINDRFEPGVPHVP